MKIHAIAVSPLASPFPRPGDDQSSFAFINAWPTCETSLEP